MHIRLATIADAAAINVIYTHYVRTGVASFEFAPPTDREIGERIAKIVGERPWLVQEEAGEVWAYAYAGRHGERLAYQWSVDVSVYVHPDRRGSGLGRALYRELFQQLKGLGYYNAYAGITLPNAGSVGLHESFGFVPVGIYRNVGFKLGRWWDVGWWQKRLCAHTVPVDAPLALAG